MNYYELIEQLDAEDKVIHVPDYIPQAEIEAPILLMTHELTRTGAPMQMLYLSCALLELNKNIVLFSIRDGELLNEFLSLGVTVVCHTMGDVNANWLDKVAELFDVVFANTLVYAPFVNYLSPKMGRVFWWIHESSYYFNDEYCKNVTIAPSLHILSASLKVKNDLIIKYMNRESKLLNVCVKDEGMANYGVADRLSFFWVGTYDANKSVDIYLEAFLDLPEEYRNRINLVICGNRTEHEDYYQLAMKFADSFPNVILYEGMPHDKLMRIMKSIDVVVVSSVEESTSLVAVEGMMSGKTVICSDGCGVANFIEDGKNGFIFPIRDHVKLSEKMQYIIENKDILIELNNESRKTYETYYTYEAFKENVKELLENTTNELKK